MADAENKTHSSNLPVFQPLPSTHIVNVKACFSQKQQKQPDLQTCLNNSFKLFSGYTYVQVWEISSKIVEKSPARSKGKGKTLRRCTQSDDKKASSER